MARASEFAGRRVRLTVLPQEAEAPITTAEDSTPEKSIEEKIEELIAKVPPPEWEKLPKDLYDNLDHYTYGTPKRR